MLDPKIIRDEPEKVRKMLKDRAVEFDFDKMLEPVSYTHLTLPTILLV